MRNFTDAQDLLQNSQGFSIEDLTKMDKTVISEAIFTNDKEIALCDSVEKV